MSDYSSDDYDNEEPEYIPVSLQECGKCGRKFNEEALARHAKVCSKVNKPRKVFDSKKQRLENFQNETIKIKQPEPKKTPKKKDWRRTHEEFIKTIRAARGVSHAQKTGSELPPPPSPTFNPDYIQCPHCNRRFNESAAERHINFCKEQKSRLPKQSSDSKYSLNKAKQQLRTQYRPPVPGQKKKSVDSPSKQTRHASSPGTKTDKSPATNMKKYGMHVDRETKSDSVLVTGKRKTERAPRPEPNEERPINSRYSKTTSRISSAGSASDNEKPRSGKYRTGDPKWFEDLKRHDSGNVRKQRHVVDIDQQDSGLDLNSNFSSHYRGREHPVGVVRPSSRSKENALDDEIGERKVSAGRRKMANFCHDCGTKYPVTNAKFCCECGVRRMTLT